MSSLDIKQTTIRVLDSSEVSENGYYFQDAEKNDGAHNLYYRLAQTPQYNLVHLALKYTYGYQLEITVPTHKDISDADNIAVIFSGPNVPDRCYAIERAICKPDRNVNLSEIRFDKDVLTGIVALIDAHFINSTRHLYTTASIRCRTYVANSYSSHWTTVYSIGRSVVDREQALPISLTLLQPYPAKGMLLSNYCKGIDHWANYADGQGGTYDVVLHLNSSLCGGLKS